jgi:putative hydrolase of the HAD superfamily
LIVGKEDPSTMWRSIGDDLGLSSQEVDDLSRGFWGEPVWNDGVFGLIDSNQSVKHAVLSDAWMGTREIMRPRINSDVFDTVMFSAEEGRSKPGAEIFLRMSSRLGVEPTRILFVDDRIENVKGARAVGMKATQFTDTPDVFDPIETSLRDAE